VFLKFPKDFLWGAATSAHQVEGNNHNDWSQWEKKNASRLASQAHKKWAAWQQKKFPEMFNPENYISSVACDHYNYYEGDFIIAKELGHNSHRFSVEWSRIEPEKGRFNKNELAHYKAVARCLRVRGIEPFVTLWHWSLPLWLSNKKGILNRNFPKYFTRYAEFVVDGLKDEVSFWMTLNEPTLVVAQSYLRGVWPPQKKGILGYLRAYRNLSMAHNLAYDSIHKFSSSAKVGIANVLAFIEPQNKKSLIDKLIANFFRHYSNEKIYEMTDGKHDFLGIQYYFHNTVGIGKRRKFSSEEISDMGWEICPEGIYRVLKEVKKYNLPVYITENGIADKYDSKRSAFIKDHLTWVHKAISEGVDVRGYFYWSLMDNFEWEKGFWPRFGLVKVDYKNQRRTIRKSAFDYRDIIEKNGLEL
jgi:beta-glucosidase